MNTNRKTLILCLALPLGIGGLAAWLTRDGFAQYAALVQPPLAPPGWVFPVVWTILYLLMGYSSWRIVETPEEYPPEKRNALIAYGAQLIANFIWPLLFFGIGYRLTAFFWLCILWLLICITIKLFSDMDRLAGKLLIPYCLWVTFAGYLNLGVVLLNGI